MVATLKTLLRALPVAMCTHALQEAAAETLNAVLVACAEFMPGVWIC